jgi:hypothetical protein
VEQALKVLQEYYPISPTEIVIHGPGSFVRFSSILTRFHETADGWVWFFENNKPGIVAYLDTPTLDRNDTLIQELFTSDDLKNLFKTVEFLKSVDWRNSPATLYGQTIFIDEDDGWVHFEAHYMLPQLFQAELDERRIKPTKKLIVNKVTETQAKDFMHRKEALAKLFRGTKNER